MDTIGIVAEYNPFHNGHLYQIKRIRELTGAKNIVVVISGDFVQRGTPAWTDKYLRTRMALSQNIDMVFELPVTFAASSAETFARAGISLLTSLGFVDGICFGSECDSLPLLQKIANFLANPPVSFEETIHSLTACGLSYPAARQRALSSVFADQCKKYPDLLSGPNNILALEYLKAIQQLKSPLIPLLIPRQGNGYHSESLDGPFSSATAIRKAGTQKESFLQSINKAVPIEILDILEKHSDRYPVMEDHFSGLLYYRLMHLTGKDTAILDMTEEIFHRIQKKLPDFISYSDFAAKIKTKQYTYSRISRVLLHCLLDITTLPAFPPLQKCLPYVPYARLLGFNREKSALLRCKSASIPVIAKPADGLAQIQNFYHETTDQSENYIHDACSLYEKDLFASNLYRQVQNTELHCIRPNEYRCQPIIHQI